jgi:hypothetical protein
MARTYYVMPMPAIHTASGAAFTTFTTFQKIAPTPGVVLPANLLEMGTRIRLTARGEFSNTGTPTLGVGFGYGASTVLAAGTALTTITGAAAWPWWSEWIGTVRAVGTSGSIQGAGSWMLGISLTAFSVDQAMPATQALRTVTLDTTAASEIWPGAVWGTSSASNSIKVDMFSVEILS